MKIFLKPYKPAQLYSGKGDWYVYYHYKNPETGEWEMFKDRAGLNYKDLRESPKARKEIGEEIRDLYNERLKSGWSPYAYESKQSEDYEQLKFLPLIKVLYQLLEIKQGSLKRRTYQSYKYSIAVFEKWIKANNLQHVSPEFFTDNNARGFVDSIMGAGKLKNKSINGHVTNLKIMLNMCIDRELIVKNPFRKIKPLQVEVGKNFPFNENQKKHLKEKILEDHPELWMFVKCIYHLFIRPVELLRVKVGDVDLRTRQVIIHSESGKNKKQLPVEIPESFMEEVKSWKLDEYPSDWYLFGVGDKKTKNATYKPGPKQMKRNTVTNHHAEILKALKIDRTKHSMYSWKHTGNVDSYLAGIDVYDLMRQNRHHSLEQTMGYLQSMGLRPNVNFSKKAPKL
jgi:integrase